MAASIAADIVVSAVSVTGAAVTVADRDSVSAFANACASAVDAALMCG